MFHPCAHNFRQQGSQPIETSSLCLRRFPWRANPCLSLARNKDTTQTPLFSSTSQEGKDSPQLLSKEEWTNNKRNPGWIAHVGFVCKWLALRAWTTPTTLSCAGRLDGQQTLMGPRHCMKKKKEQMHELSK